MTECTEAQVGPGIPPTASRFPKGQSGNPAGRPKRPVDNPPYESVFGQLVSIEDEKGMKRQVNVENAILLKLSRQAMQNDMFANRLLLKLAEQNKAIFGSETEDDTTYICITGGFGGISANPILLKLGMIAKLRSDSASPTMLISPWLVETALERFGEHQLTIEEQREVWENTRTPNKVKWPIWWTERRGTGRRRSKTPLRGRDGSYPPCIVPKPKEGSQKR